MSKFSQGFCPECDKKVLTLKTPVNHILHFILSLFSFGLWIPVWLVVSIANDLTPWRCNSCGTVVKS